MISLTPIFIVGAQRSGTTFLAERLGRYAGVLTTPEAQVMKRLLAAGDAPLPPEKARALAAATVQDFRFWTLGISVAQDQMTEILISHGGHALVQAFLSAYQDKQGVGNAQFWVEHSPENLLDLPWLLRALPDAKVVHIIRDGRGVLASFRGLNWGPHSARRTAEYWLSCVMSGAAQSAHMPDRAITIRYEDILMDEPRHLEHLAKFLGLAHAGAPPPSEAASFELPSFTKAQHELVGGAALPARATAWRDSLPPRDIAIFEHFAGLGLDHFGYPTPEDPQPFQYSGRDAATDYLKDGWKLLASRLRRGHSERAFVRKNLRHAATDQDPS